MRIPLSVMLLATRYVTMRSENAGAHEELSDWAVTVNPFDIAGQADAIHAALEMPAEERAARCRAIRAHIREHDLAEWVEGQLADLDAAGAPARARP